MLAMTGTVAAHNAPWHAGRVLHANLTGAAEVPPADPDGLGSARISVNYGQRRVCWQLSFSNISVPAIAAHIHEAAAGVNGPVVVPLFTDPNSTGFSKGCATVTRTLAKKLIQHPERYYVNVHTADFPGGAIRGQLAKGHGSTPKPPVTALKIVKLVDGNATGWTGGTFGFTVTCGAAAPRTITIELEPGETTGSKKLTDIAPGTTCTVVENTGALPTAGANATWSALAYNPAGGSATLVLGSTVSVTVTNTRSVTPGSLQINKAISGSLVGWTTGTFNFTVTCGAAAPISASVVVGAGGTGSTTVNGLTAGASCTVAETAPLPDPGTGHAWGSTSYAPSATATIPAASTVGVTVTNART
jgi:hypothetical protein